MVESTAPLIIPHRGLILPGGIPTIDWTNQITRGLVGCWITTGEEGSRIVRDYVTQVPAIATNTGNKIVAGPNGMVAVDNEAAVAAWTSTLTTAQQPGSALSWMYFGQSQASYPGGGDSNGMFAGRFNATGGSPFVSWGYLRGSSGGTGTLDMQASFNNPALQIDDLLNIIPAVKATFCVASVLNLVTGAGTLTTYRNGQLFQTVTGLTITPTTYGTTPKFCIGPDPSGDDQTTFMGFMMGCLWSRALEPGEAALMTADPTNFLIYPMDFLRNLIVGKTAAGGQTIFIDWLIPAEYGANLQSDGNTPFTTVGNFRLDENVPFESLSTDRSDANVPAEWTATARDDRLVPFSLIAGMRLDYAIPFELTGGVVRSDVSVPLEYLTSLRGDVITPFEQLATDRGDQQVPFTWAGNVVRSDQNIPAEWLAAIRRDTTSPFELMSNIRLDYAPPVEWLSNIRSDVIAPFEQLSSFRLDENVPFEQLFTARGDNIVPFELLSTAKVVQIDWLMPFELTANIRSDDLVPFRTSASIVRSDQNIPAAWVVTVRTDAQAAFEDLATARRDNLAPFELLGNVIRSDQNVVMEWLAKVQSNQSAPFELIATLKFVSIDYQIPFAYAGVTIVGKAKVLVSFVLDPYVAPTPLPTPTPGHNSIRVKFTNLIQP